MRMFLKKKLINHMKCAAAQPRTNESEMDNMCFEACPTKITNYAFLRKKQFNAKQLFRGVEAR